MNCYLIWHPSLKLKAFYPLLKASKPSTLIVLTNIKPLTAIISIAINRFIFFVYAPHLCQLSSLISRLTIMNAYVDDDRLKILLICVIMKQFFIPKRCVISAKTPSSFITVVQTCYEHSTLSAARSAI